ncbi:serine hydrolase [Pusillimonas sp. ANT_WB101]|uniref:serine hydrolase domain-containing protein n=1 Tax=Pusillimonas sp. ANT_WB101 TaxID=2597356 RepID=UPI0011ECD9FE|nr:serine hydrolase domain-containing protein [Pusillimonas sp. ANT_WB101]KAA0910390.1 beta-lactamase family protein [Pusillimonas sp. ANT_WB101]
MSEDLIAAVSQLMALGTGRKVAQGESRKTSLNRFKLDFKNIRPGEMQQNIEIATVTSLMRRAFEDWADDQQLESGSFAVLRRGNVAGVASYGGESARSRNEFASCSKLITGLAVAQLVRAGKLGWDTTMEQVFGRFFRIGLRHLREIIQLREPRVIDILSRYTVDERQVGKQKVFDVKAKQVAGKLLPLSHVVPVLVAFPAWFRNLTVTQVMTHTSGIRGDLGEGNPYDISIDDRFALIVFSQQAAMTYSYENNNMLVLGKVVEQLTAQGFREAVLDLVMKPLGITDFDTDNRGPYAGCWLSTANYAKMMRYLDQDLELMGAFGPASWPMVSGYSIGTHMSRSVGSYETSHSGAWTWGDSTRNVSYGANQQYWHDVRTGYFVRFARLGADTWTLNNRLRAIAIDPNIPSFDLLEILDVLKKASGGGS